MTLSGDRHEDAGSPCAEEIRAALDGMLVSEVFRGSPQLAAFLRYVVETTLRGEADRIKGYTIAIEALGRDAAFDPQTDPIVRVEAARLRRALSRYYANGGGAAPVRIELPLGHYVPAFHRVAVSRRPEWRALRIDWPRLATGAALMLAGAAVYAFLDFYFDFNTPRPQAGQTIPSCASQAVHVTCLTARSD
jgi:hypothetical protein